MLRGACSQGGYAWNLLVLAYEAQVTGVVGAGIRPRDASFSHCAVIDRSKS